MGIAICFTMQRKISLGNPRKRIHPIQNTNIIKMEKAGFITVKSNFVNAPIITELPLTLECELDKVLDELFVGRIVNVCADERIVGEDGKISLEKFSPITYDTVNLRYYRLGECVGTAFKEGNALK